MLDKKYLYYIIQNRCARSPVGKASVKLADSNKVWLPNAQVTIK